MSDDLSSVKRSSVVFSICEPSIALFSTSKEGYQPKLECSVYLSGSTKNNCWCDQCHKLSIEMILSMIYLSKAFDLDCDTYWIHVRWEALIASFCCQPVGPVYSQVLTVMKVLHPRQASSLSEQWSHYQEPVSSVRWSSAIWIVKHCCHSDLQDLKEPDKI